jgi:hypothetical protein
MVQVGRLMIIMMLQEQARIVRSKPGGNRTNDPNYDGVNVAGDETVLIYFLFPIRSNKELLLVTVQLQEDYSEY